MPEMILPMIDRLRRVMILRYLVASVGALAVDMGAFLILLAAGMMPALASAFAYGLGIGAHWLLSSRAVFSASVAADRGARNRQKALFVGSALVGLALTTMIVGAGSALGLDSRLAKIVAIGASFVATWLLRKQVVFR
ncbi:MAG: GtrA family protein [Novosphingobium meiothermophilum]|uniref:GtrA family protein n=1 Tax=Novosphingobium TaxID=165696 RepID=UPI000D6DD270|nr:MULTISPECIES: GtrA family protein [Novosphingobium]